MKPIEESFFINQQDSCTPETMLQLISILVKESTSMNESWISKSSKIICDKMRQCKTGNDLIRKACLLYPSHIENTGDKTGSMGGIVNDAAFMQLQNGQWVILTIYTCLSPLEKDARQSIIVKIAQDLLDKNLDLNAEKNCSNKMLDLKI